MACVQLNIRSAIVIVLIVMFNGIRSHMGNYLSTLFFLGNFFSYSVFLKQILTFQFVLYVYKN